VTDDLNVPLAYEIVKKDQVYADKKTGKTKRRSQINKNEMFRNILNTVVTNRVKFKYLVADSRFCNKKNMQQIVEFKRHFIMEIPHNRLVSLSKEEKLGGKYKSIDSLGMAH
jgi:hypothetical protein